MEWPIPTDGRRNRWSTTVGCSFILRRVRGKRVTLLHERGKRLLASLREILTGKLYFRKNSGRIKCQQHASELLPDGNTEVRPLQYILGKSHGR